MSEKQLIPEVVTDQKLDLLSLSWGVDVPDGFRALSSVIEPFAFPPGNITAGGGRD